MEIVKYVLLGIYVIVCIALIIVATIQGGASETIMGSSTNNFYEKNKGRTREGRLKRMTVILGIAFVVLSVVVGILYAI